MRSLGPSRDLFSDHRGPRRGGPGGEVARFRFGRHLAGLLPVALAVVIVGGTMPTAVAAATATPSGRAPVQVFPAPGSRTASAGTQISFRGTTDPGAVSVVGSVTGAHPGRWLVHGDNQGASFLPTTPFAPGETVTVTSGLAVTGSATGTFSYLVARPAPVSAAAAASIYADVAPAAGNPTTASSASAPVSGAAASAPYKSRPDLRPPPVTVQVADPGHAPGLLLASSGAATSTADPGVFIYDDTGQPVWFKTLPPNGLGNLSRLTYRGQDALAWFAGTSPWQGGFKGSWIVADSTYTRIGEIAAGNGYFADGHDLRISPAGDKALVEIYNPVETDLSEQGGSRTASVLEAVIQEIDLATGAVTFEWHSLDHIPVTDTYQSLQVTDPDPAHQQVVDYVHINSVDYDTSGDILVSSRHLSAVLEIAKSSGQVLWRLGGKHSDYTIVGPDPAGDYAPSFPHDARRQPDGTISVYDNGYLRTPPYGRGISWHLDDATHTATAVTVRDHGRTLFGPIVGSNRVQPNGDSLVSYGNTGHLTEYDSTGRVVFDDQFGGNAWTYRTVRTPDWHGRPAEPPAMAIDRAGDAVTAYASWNGATEVADWAVLAGPDPASLRPVGPRVTRTGFETTLKVTVAPADTVVEVQAYDATGRAIGHSVPDPILAKWTELGGSSSVVGTPVGGEYSVGDGQAQDYTGGMIAWSPASGAHAVHGAISAEYAACGGPAGLLGFPTTDETGLPDGVGRVSSFLGGQVYWTPATGAHEVHGEIAGRYAGLSGPAGLLGYPVTDETAAPDGVGRFNHFTGGSVYWSPASGAHEVHGAIRAHWAALGGEQGVLGYPVTDETGTGDHTGRYNNFTGGAMYWSPPSGAHEVHGDILAHWADLGAQQSAVGYPVTDETTAPDGAGRYNYFTGGAVYWSPETGAHEVQGAILAGWAGLGWEQGPLGYPVSDEYGVAGGRRSDFQGGFLYWDELTGTVGASMQ
jgi:uncharacterized protein with LGFP repeats